MGRRALIRAISNVDKIAGVKMPSFFGYMLYSAVGASMLRLLGWNLPPSFNEDIFMETSVTQGLR